MKRKSKIEVLRQFLAERKKINAKRDGWRPSELAMSLADIPQEAKKLARSFRGHDVASVEEHCAEALKRLKGESSE